jgi:phospholipid/cholesterol/gamma-HCH transport system substrate-binding protein
VSVRRGFYGTVAMATVATLVVAAALWWLLLAPAAHRFTAHFGSAVGLFPGSDVRVLGVKVGEIDSVTPKGTVVEVVIEVDRDTPLPAEVGAVSVAPSLVSDRYVQLTPVYTGGPTLADGAEIPRERTANPLELDELYASLDRLTTALGPDGANADGALSDFIEVQADVLEGNGATFNRTIDELSAAARTLSDSRLDLFATVDNLATFTASLAANDAQVRRFNDRLADVSAFLASERTDLAEALQQLTVALNEVSVFVRDHRDVLRTGVDKLTRITQLLVDQKADLQEFLDVAPLGISNLANAYNGYGGGLETRMNLNELADPSLLLCKSIGGASVPADLATVLPPEFVAACQNLIGRLGAGLGLPSPADVLAAVQRGELPPIPILGASEPATVGGGG